MTVTLPSPVRARIIKRSAQNRRIGSYRSEIILTHVRVSLRVIHKLRVHKVEGMQWVTKTLRSLRGHHFPNNISQLRAARHARNRDSCHFQ
jgi:hypothetical protein